MRRPLSPNRRKAAVLAGSAAALAGSLNLLHQHSPADLSDHIFVMLIAVTIGAMLGASILLLIRDRRACSRS
jgi:hypothetical protein